MFKLIFLNENYFTEICSWGTDWIYIIIGADKGLGPNRRQVIIWTNDGLAYWRMYVSLGINESEKQRAYGIANVYI